MKQYFKKSFAMRYGVRAAVLAQFLWEMLATEPVQREEKWWVKCSILQLTFPSLPSEAEQINIIAQEADAQARMASAFSVPQQVIDEVLASGGNEPDSALRIAAQFRKDKPLAENAAFLQHEFESDGKGFRFDGKQVSVWFDARGIRIAYGERARYEQPSTVLSWEQAAVRIRTLLDEGMYLPQDQLDRIDRYERERIAESLLYLFRETDGPAYFPTIGNDRGGFPENQARVSELLDNPVKRDALIVEMESFVTAYRADKSILRFHYHHPEKLLERLRDLAIIPIPFRANESVSYSFDRFITQDEVDLMLTDRPGGVEGSKYRIYTYFMQNAGAQDRIRFLREEYGTGGFGKTGYDENHDSKGIVFSRGTIGKPYDKVTLPWKKVAARIAELIDAGRYLSSDELKQLPAFNSYMLALRVVGFFRNQPPTVPRPYPSDAKYAEEYKSIIPQLSDPARVASLIEQMTGILDNTANFDRNYGYMRLCLQDLKDYQAGNYAPYKNREEPVQPPATAPESPKAESEPTSVEVKEQEPETASKNYSLHLGDEVHIGTDTYVILDLGNDMNT